MTAPSYRRFSPGDLDGLLAEVVGRLRLEPEEANALIHPPRLRVSTGIDQSINSHTVGIAGKPAVILMGRGLYPLCEHYARTAAACFLPTSPGGVLPSENWPAARASLANAVEWLASPVEMVPYQPFPLTAHQEEMAGDFALHMFRFALCHEIAHVALGHLNEIARVGAHAIGDAQWQEREFAADRTGLEFHVGTVPPSDSATAYASAVYTIHAMALLDWRAMLLAGLIDPDAWKIEYTHPPHLARFAFVMAKAKALSPRAGDWLMTVRGSLTQLDGEVMTFANTERARVADEANRLVASGFNATNAAALQTLFAQSPLGVMRALDGPDSATDAFAELVPAEFQAFHQMDLTERARVLATRI